MFYSTSTILFVNNNWFFSWSPLYTLDTICASSIYHPYIEMFQTIYTNQLEQFDENAHIANLGVHIFQVPFSCVHTYHNLGMTFHQLNILPADVVTPFLEQLGVESQHMLECANRIRLLLHGDSPELRAEYHAFIPHAERVTVIAGDMCRLVLPNGH